MAEHQLVSPQGNLLPGNTLAVPVVSPQRCPDVAHLGPDLVLPAGFQADGAQGGTKATRIALIILTWFLIEIFIMGNNGFVILIYFLVIESNV